MESNKPRFYLRVHVLPLGGLMASIVDEESLGVVERDHEKGLVIDVSEHFYKGDLVDEEGALKAMDEAEVMILVGRRAVSLGIRAGYVHQDAVLKVGSLEYAQVFKFREHY
ncbi:MAG: DUF424 family protein [Acidilobaceae archaeon]